MVCNTKYFFSVKFRFHIHHCMWKAFAHHFLSSWAWVKIRAHCWLRYRVVIQRGHHEVVDQRLLIDSPTRGNKWLDPFFRSHVVRFTLWSNFPAVGHSLLLLLVWFNLLFIYLSYLFFFFCWSLKWIGLI